MDNDDRLYQIRKCPKSSEARPAEPGGGRAWRSLRELDGTPPSTARAFELPAAAAAPPGAIARRAFMQLAGGALALASAGCAAEVPRQILPYTRQPDGVVPGMATFYATSMPLDGYASGLLVESREGRPTKIEGNPDHPATLGATSRFQQASIRQLYDDARARRVRRGADPSSWEDLFAMLRAPRNDRGAGVRVLIEPTTSPLLLHLLDRVQKRLPAARVAFHAPLETSTAQGGARLAFDRTLLPLYDLSVAEVILSLDADLLDALPFSLRYARQWAGRRRLESAHDRMSRLYVAESLLSVTGSMADNRLARPISRIPALAFAVAAQLPLPAALRAAAASRADTRPDVHAWAKSVAADLSARPRGHTAIVVGDRQPAALHALGYAMNDALGNLGKTVMLVPPALPEPGDGVQTLEELVTDMRAGQVETLMILEGNPVYSAPADLSFAQALSRVENAIHVGSYENETAELCGWFAPTAHYLESWGDGRAYDGTVSMIQPLIRPLFDGRTPAEVLAALAGDRFPDGYRLLRDYWLAEQGLTETSFEEAIRLGLQTGTAFSPVAMKSASPRVERALTTLSFPAEPASGELELELHPSPTVYDGRFANNPWLQEQATPIGKLTWDNAALLSPATARTLGVASEQVVELRLSRSRLKAPVLVVPGTAEGVVAVWLGYGRRGAETIAAGVGFDAYPVRTREHLHTIPALKVAPLDQRHSLALTQEHWYTHDRPIALRKTLEDYRREPNFAAPYRAAVPSMFPAYQYQGDQWAMSIDLAICTGCSACMLACQAENNIPVVGKPEVMKSREMSWLRIDTYFFGSPSDPRVVHQPMMCQHCEKAPCEYVCPVEATTHSPDGLNEMTYNRCVGTRFCSNNCPYKVRRFNWFNWGSRVSANRGPVELQYNPEVTVRERGVMEKCTYCVQRIRVAQIAASLDNRALRAGEVVTACQATCPTGAIQFGSLAHRDTAMVRWRQQDRSYAVLQQEEGTQPRTAYLARIDNPNPEIV